MSTPLEFRPLVDLWRNSAGMPGTVLAARMAELPIEPALSQVLQVAVQGDNRPLNTWLFAQGSLPASPLAWIAPLGTTPPNYVWMVGRTSEVAATMHAWFAGAREATAKDHLLGQTLISPPLLFVNPTEVSKTTTGDTGLEDEFAIFQVGYKNAATEVSDLEQRMVINANHATMKRRAALHRLRHLCGAESDMLDTIESNLELFALLHNEGHNQGHFVGAWPHDEVFKKKAILYEAVEEFRACLAAILLCEHLPLRESEKDAFAVSVFMTRFLGFGYEAHLLPTQRRETVREITVGLFFFEWLLQGHVISVRTSGEHCYLDIDYEGVRPSLIAAFQHVNMQEAAISPRSKAALGEIATSWYQLGFPGAAYSQSALAVYNCLIDHERR